MTEEKFSCPSAPSDGEDSKVFGIVGGTPEKPQVSYLGKGVEVPTDRLALPPGVVATRIFRFAGGCVAGGCAQFSNGQCQLGNKVQRFLDPVVDQLPACTIRATCRWFAENGRDICFKCPQVVTTVYEGDAFEPVSSMGK